MAYVRHCAVPAWNTDVLQCTPSCPPPPPPTHSGNVCLVKGMVCLLATYTSEYDNHSWLVMAPWKKNCTHLLHHHYFGHFFGKKKSGTSFMKRNITDWLWIWVRQWHPLQAEMLAETGTSPPGVYGELGTPGSPNTLFGTPRFCKILALALVCRPSQTSHWLAHMPHFPSRGPALIFLLRHPRTVMIWLSSSRPTRSCLT